jgi:small subunit ribosomal protein S6
MREYELIYIVHPELDETAVKELTTKIQGWITDAGGSISKLDFWGKRRLAYPIRKQIEGQYVYIRVMMAPTFVITLERNLRFTEPVMRFLLTVIDE